MELLKGIGFSGYRSIGEKPVLLYPFSKINLFIGPNNVGKSNILKLIYNRYNNGIKLKSFDFHKYDKSINIHDYYPFEESELRRIFSGYNIFEYRSPKYSSIVGNAINRLLKSDLFHYSEIEKLFWDGEDVKSNDLLPYVKSIDSNELRDFTLNFANSCDNGYSIESKVLNTLIIINSLKSKIKSQRKKEYKALYIKATRDLYDHSKNTFLDNTIISELGSIVNRGAGDVHLQDIENNLNTFVSELIGEDVSLKVPQSLDTININYNKNKTGKSLYSLDQLGSGIHEIIYFALVATLNTGALICIDEPEIHMHPRLQRKFIDYISQNTDNQYFIATHSSAFINGNDANVSIFGVDLDKEGCTTCTYSMNNKDLSIIVDSLGCKASDILQSNCVIWVEGPSDRIYLNYWIKGKTSNLIEGIDYSIMFYGGRLLSHLSGDCDIEDDLIKLMRINKNSFIVIDSDKRDADDDINDTKKRILDEFGDKCWITKGREIENYLNNEEYENVLKDLGINSLCIKNSIFDNRLSYKSGNVNKVNFAKALVEKYEIPSYEKLDLDTKINELVNFIANASK